MQMFIEFSPSGKKEKKRTEKETSIANKKST